MFDELIQNYGNRLYALCLKLCNRHEDDANDLYQETCLKAYKSIHQYDTNKKFEPWISTICANTYKDMYRKKKLISYISFSNQEDQQAMLDNIQIEPEDENYNDVREAIEQLPIRLKTCILLYYFNGSSVEETAQALKIPAGTVKSRLSKARKLLEKELQNNE